jgi:hypothetical protein
MINVSRTEPDPALFRVPADYATEEQTPPRPVPVAPNPARRSSLEFSKKKRSNKSIPER